MAGAGALVAAAASLLMVVQLQPEWWQRWRGPQVDPRFAKLVEAVGEERYIEGRLTGGFKYGPMRQVMRGPGDLSSQNLQLLAAAGELQKAAEKDPSAENLHASAASFALLGDFSQAVELLRQLDEPTPSALNDLGVALMGRSRSDDLPADVPQALESIEAALALQPELPEAWFNKALILEQLGLRAEAIKAWERVGELEHEERWRLEAHIRAQRLRRESADRSSLIEHLQLPEVVDADVERIAREHPEELRDAIAEIYLPEWVEAEARGRGERAANRLTVAIEALEPGGDPLFRASVGELKPRLSRGDDAPLLDAVGNLRRGLAALRENRYADAFDPLTACHRVLRTAAPSLDAWVAVSLARVLYFQGAGAAALALLDNAAQSARHFRSPALEGRVAWVRGLVHFTGGDWGSARGAFDLAEQSYRASGEIQLASNVLINLSILARSLGDVQLAWRHRLAALQHMPWRDTRNMHGYLITSAVTASQHGYHHTALLYQAAVVDNAALLQPSERAEARLQRARMLDRAARGAEALSELSAAEFELDRIADPRVRDRVRLSLLTAKVAASFDVNPSEALRLGAEAIAQSTRNRDLLRVAELQLHLSRASSRLGRRDDALEAVKSGVAAFEHAVDSVDPANPARLSATETVWELYAEGARLHLQKPTPDQGGAFELLERGRARTLRALRQQPPIDLATAQQRLRDREGLLMLVQSATALSVWQVTRGDAKVTVLPIDRVRSEVIMRSHAESIDAPLVPDGRPVDEAADLLAPVLEGMTGVDTLAVVADPPWASVVWPAIAIRDSGVHGDAIRFVSSPSATMALSGTRAVYDQSMEVVVVVPPKRKGYPALPEAEREARVMAALRPTTRILASTHASAGGVRAAMQSAAILHYAGHAVDVASNPDLSHLVVAPSPEDPFGRLSFGDVIRSPARSLRLVVLAACSTSGDAAFAGEGSVGMAWAFIAAGAQHVVAMRWPVDDAVAARFSEALHRDLAATGDPIGAVARASEQLRRNGHGRREWQSPMVIGSL